MAEPAAGKARETLHPPWTDLPKSRIPPPGSQGLREGESKKKGAATYSPALLRSTIGAGGLNFSVRDGKRWGTTAIATMNGVDKTPQARDTRRPPASKNRRAGSFGQLVALGFGVAAFTPAPYQRHRL